MPPLTISNALEPFTEEHLRKTEDMIGVSFPEDYVAFLELHNGGSLKEKYFPLGDNEKVVEFLLGLIPDYKTHERGSEDIGVVWSQLESRLGEGLVPIAAAYPGDIICLDISDDTASVVLWDHERSGEDDPYTTPIADSFTAFLKLLHA